MEIEPNMKNIISFILNEHKFTANRNDVQLVVFPDNEDLVVQSLEVDNSDHEIL